MGAGVGGAIACVLTLAAFARQQWTAATRRAAASPQAQWQGQGQADDADAGAILPVLPGFQQTAL